MKHGKIIVIVFSFLYSSLLGQTFKVSSRLMVTQITPSTFIHTCNNNNGLIYVDKNEAIVVSTPASDQETDNLIRWVKNELKVEIIGYVIDRWHPDAMEGLDVVKKHKIPSYANQKTIGIAKKKKLPIPEIAFQEKSVIKVGGKEVVCHYLGEAHTSDGIVVWVPESSVLFAGNGIRNDNGWIGNIADANLSEWSTTARSIKSHYQKAQIVVPGHGALGGTELIDYTIKLYDFPKNINVSNTSVVNDFKLKDVFGELSIEADSKESKEGKITYSKGVATIEKKQKVFTIYADGFRFNPSKSLLTVSKGILSVKGVKNTESFCFKELFLFQNRAIVEMALVVKGVITCTD